MMLKIISDPVKERLWCKNKRYWGKNFTTSDYDKFMNEMLDEKIKNKILVNNCDIFELIKKSNLDRKIKYLQQKDN